LSRELQRNNVIANCDTEQSEREAGSNDAGWKRASQTIHRSKNSGSPIFLTGTFSILYLSTPNLKKVNLLLRVSVICCLLLPAIAWSQPLALPDHVQREYSPEGLFESNELLHIRIAGRVGEVINDRGDNSKYHSLTFSYLTKDSSKISMPVKIKTRGHFRKLKSNCTWPPLLINFIKKDIPKLSPFQGQDKLKLVMPCRGDEYVVREWLLYKLYNLITPKSFKARLVRVTMDDSIKKKQNSFYGILLEDEEQMAHRNKAVIVEKTRLNPLNTEPNAFLTMAVFQYMIGNTDWSVQFQQNVTLLAKDSLGIPTTVPYDFDHAGLVDAPYAKPTEELEMNAVTERRYRGYCIADMKTYAPVIALFNGLKKDFYNVYTGCSLVNAKYIKTATRYLDDFYATINDPKALQKAFGYPCDKNGTGNIIIKGLKKD
jgi:hypothetical protein